MPPPFAVGSIATGPSQPLYLHPDLLFELQLDMEREGMLGMANKLEQHLDPALNRLGSKRCLYPFILLPKKLLPMPLPLPLGGPLLVLEMEWALLLLLEGMFTNMLALVPEPVDPVD